MPLIKNTPSGKSDATRSPLKKLDAAVIAPKPARRRRAVLFQWYVLAATAGFVGLAVAARFVPYFPIDVTITRAVQSYDSDVFNALMYGISWIGFFPQSLVIGLAPVGLLFAIGLRWEAVMTFFASCSVWVSILIKIAVSRPRPTIDVVQVISELSSSSFPSGHVLNTTTLCGFLAFLCFTLLKASWEETALVALFTSFIPLMGVSRIHQGHHWFSDVMGAYLLGSLWLLLAIRIYRWGKPRYFVRQPVAPERASPVP
jgi:undecaprenyl-diphosphatase